VSARGRAFKDPEAFRAWLRSHHATAREVILRCYKTSHARRGITYRQGLDEALCFGWIDGVRHGLDESSFLVRFTPRKARSGWSQVNLRRAAELRAEGRMLAPGLAALERRALPTYSYESVPRVLSGDFLKRFRARREAWRFFQAQPAGYRKTSVFWVLSAKRPATREARFAVLLANAEARKRIPLLRREAPGKAKRGEP
jgi:uncharacterized protein YdeI (YjbR/CyaY-like superfamily)